MKTFLDFEKSIAELEGKIEELRRLSNADEMNIVDEIGKLEGKAARQLRRVYASLTPWQKVQVARHPERPHFSDYVAGLLEDYTPLAGDRAYADDKAIQGGLGRFRGRSCMVIGTEKGDDTESRVRHNFGMASPEGYRKAMRLMRLAEQFALPVITFIDTPGAYPGIGAEERGQAEAIARSIELCLNLQTPITAIIIGEGGSGGALAIAVADQVLMLEHSVYSVISPEGCASILWRDATQAQTAAEALRITAADMVELKMIDDVVPEPLGGAHRNRQEMFLNLGNALEKALAAEDAVPVQQRRARRYEKFMKIGSAENFTRQGKNG